MNRIKKHLLYRLRRRFIDLLNTIDKRMMKLIYAGYDVAGKRLGSAELKMLKEMDTIVRNIVDKLEQALYAK